MTGKDVALEIIIAFIPALGIPLISYTYRWLNMQSRLKRRDLLIEMDEPGYCQKQQRKVFTRLGFSVYFIGACFAVSAMGAPAALLMRSALGIIVAVLGGMAAANAMTMNEYGVELQRKQFAAMEKKEEEKAQKRALLK